MSDSRIQIDIGDCVSGDLNIVGENVIINISGSVEGSITVKQQELADPDDVVVTVGGERVPNLPEGSIEPD